MGEVASPAAHQASRSASSPMLPSPPALTPAGRGVLGGSIVLYAVGCGLGYDEVSALATAGLVALLIALAWTWTMPRVVNVTRTVAPQRVIRGERADATVQVANPTRRVLRPLAAVDRVGARHVDVALPRVPAGATGTTGYRLPTARRGIVDLGPLSVIRQDPLGLMQAERRLDAPATLWIYPRIYPVSPLPATGRRDPEGPTADAAVGSVTFHALREYVVGDELRLVHWRSTARTGSLMIRQQADPSQPQTTVVLDTQCRSYGDDETFEAAVEAAASLIAASSAHRFPVHLFAGVAPVAPAATGRGSRASASWLLDHLTALRRSNGASLAETAARLAAQPGGHSLVVVTGDPDPADLLAVAALRARFGVMAVVRFRPDARAGAGWDQGVLDLVAADGPAFAALWNRQAA